MLAQEGAHDTDPPCTAPYQGIAHGEHRSHMPLALRRPVRQVVRAQPTGMGQGLGITAIRLDAPTALGIHRRVVGVSHNDLVPSCLQALGHPFAFGRGLDQDADLRPHGKNRGEPLSLRLNTLMQDLTGFGEGANLAVLFVHIDANIFHGWSPMYAAWTALCIVELYATTSG